MEEVSCLHILEKLEMSEYKVLCGGLCRVVAYGKLIGG